MATNGQELSKYVTLVSSDGFEFVVLREAACVSGAIKRMLDPKSSYALMLWRTTMTDCLFPRQFRRISRRAVYIRGDQVRFIFISLALMKRELSVMTKHDLIRQT